MFNGIVEGTGRIVALHRLKRGARIHIRAGPLARGIRRGESISVAGVCLTAVRNRNGVLTFDVMPETLRKTRFRSLRPGGRVNLERSLRFGGRVSGHFMHGHVDGLGVVRRVQRGSDYRVAIAAPAGVARLLVPKGSIAVEGVSLTVAKPGRTFEVALIPETLRRTTLASLRPGDRVHLEADLLGKYVLKSAGRRL